MSDSSTRLKRRALLLLADHDRCADHARALHDVGFGALCGAFEYDAARIAASGVDVAVLDMRLGLDFVITVVRDLRRLGGAPPVVAIADGKELPPALAAARLCLLGGVDVLYRPYHERELAMRVARAVYV